MRLTLGESVNTVTNVNYLGLSGTNVVVGIADSGVDATHPDLAGRVVGDEPASTTDVNGHGTHVAGTSHSGAGWSPPPWERTPAGR